MPVGSVGKWLVLGTLVAALGASGCKEEDEPPTDSGGPGPVDSGTPTDSGAATDSGPKDSGTTVDAAVDAGTKCGTPPMDCTGHTTGLGPVAPGCAKNYQDAEVCGISSATLLMGMEPKFLEKNAPGVASPGCGAVVDMGEPTPDAGADAGQSDAGSTKGNGKINTTLMAAGLTILLEYPGCCTKKGFCSGDGKLGKSSINQGSTWMDSDNGYGCMQSEIFFRTTPAAAMIPCNPDTGALMLPDAGASDSGAGDAGDSGASDASADAGNG
jgi:hypothetical protein